MKVFVVLVILVTLAGIFLHYKRNKDVKKVLISLMTFGIILTLATLGNITRQIIPLFIAHIILIVGAWGALIIYLIRDKYYWWMIFSPIVTLVLFLILDYFMGSAEHIM